MAPPGQSAPKPKPKPQPTRLTLPAPLTEVQEAIQAVNVSYDRAKGRLDTLLAALMKHGTSVGEEREYVWSSGEVGLLDAAYSATNDYVYLDEKDEGFPTYNLILTGKTEPKFNEPFKLYADRYKRIKEKFKDLWNGAFKNVFKSRPDDRVTRTSNAWRKKWHGLLTGQTSPTLYFEGYLEKDQNEWKMNRIWSSRIQMKKDVGYPPGGKE